MAEGRDRGGRLKRAPFFTFLALAGLLASVLLDPAATAKPRKKSRTRKPAAAVANFDARLPVLGTHLSEFPPGAAKPVADQACLACHAADLVCQQRLTEKQWTASVNKMIGWGADVSEARKAELVAYLFANFGPDNTKFQPVVTRPVGR
ncbi:MAG TPA: hypothetical protein VEO37_05160 [Thermoanaerobaculia bacterium]|nr:hypothetical protein [Thermoanaerobaculia bacterium]